MLKQSINPFLNQLTKQKSQNNMLKSLLITLLFTTSFVANALTDEEQDFVLLGDNFKNLPKVVSGQTKIKYWGNVSIEQGSLKIKADDAIIFNDKDGITRVVLTGKPVTMEKIIDQEFGKIKVKANKITFNVRDDKLLMTGKVVINSKLQGEMSGENISMNLKTKEIKGNNVNGDERVKLIIKPKSKK